MGTFIDQLMSTSTLWMPESPEKERFGLLVLLFSELNWQLCLTGRSYRYKLKESQVRAHVDRMLEAVNLPGFAKRQTHTLSGGQKQRVAIAGALAECPKVCISYQHRLSLSITAHSRRNFS